MAPPLRRTRPWLLAAFLLACTHVPARPPQTAAGRDPFTADPFFLDELLAWNGSRHGTLGPVGERLWADRLEPAPGLLGRFCYLHDGGELLDLVRLTFEGQGASLAPEALAETWHPSHHETRYALGPVRVREQKFITADDVAVTLVRFENPGSNEESVGVTIGSGAAESAGFATEEMLPLDLDLYTNLPWPRELFARPEPTSLVVAGVSFRVVDETENAGRTVIAVAGGAGRPAERPWPAAVDLPVNRAGRRLHLLGQVGPFSAGLPAGTVVGRYVVHYDDGGALAHALRLGEQATAFGTTGTLPGARGADGRFVVTIPLQPGRVVRYVRFEGGAVPEAPILVAATLELATPRDAAESLTAEQELFGVPVANALLGEVRDAGGRRLLRVRQWNRPAHALEAAVVVPPGGSAELWLAHGFAADGERARERARSALLGPDPLHQHQVAWHGWFDRNCPRFQSGDPLLDKLWWYRWFLVRHDLAVPAAGNLPGAVFYQGRHGAGRAQLVAFSSAHVLAETRWLADPEYARSHLRALLASAGADGLFRSATVDASGAYVHHGLQQAAWELNEAHPDAAFLAEMAPGLTADLDAVFARFDADGDGLPAAPYPALTGMPSLPSHSYFAGYDETAPPAALERPDLAAAAYGNAHGMARLLERQGDAAGAERMERQARRVREATLATLWHPAESCFLAVRADDGRPARVPEIVAFAPWATGLVPDAGRFARAFDLLFDPDRFGTPVPFASCSREVPVFSPHVQASAAQEEGRWNGPVWPHANSLIARALGETLAHLEQHDLEPARLREFLRAYATLHFEDGDLARPLLRATYDAETGAGAGCPDVFDSTWIDLVFRYHDLVGWPAPVPPRGDRTGAGRGSVKE